MIKIIKNQIKFYIFKLLIKKINKENKWKPNNVEMQTLNQSK